MTCSETDIPGGSLLPPGMLFFLNYGIFVFTHVCLVVVPPLQPLRAESQAAQAFALASLYVVPEIGKSAGTRERGKRSG